MPALLIGNMLEWRAMPALPRFAEIGFRGGRGFSTAPIRRIYPRRHIPMERGIWPIANLFDVTVLHRIPMDVIDMAVKIRVTVHTLLPSA